MSAFIRKAVRRACGLLSAPAFGGASGGAAFLSFLCALTLVSCLAGEYAIGVSSHDQEERIALSMRARAESLFWALEAGARFFRKKQNEPLEELLTEMARQPGVAWIAITNAQGRILHDSDPEVRGQLLYTVSELAQLSPEQNAQCRFGPDDPALYECYKLFRPERLGKRGERKEGKEPYFVFAALNAYSFQKDMNALAERLRLAAALACAAIPCFLGLLFYIYNFQLSRRRLAAAEALAMEVISNYPGGLALTDLEGGVILANAAARNLLGLGCGAPPQLDLKSGLKELIAAGGALEKEIELAGPDAAPRALSLTAALIPGEGGMRALFILRDLSEIRLLRKKLSQSRRLMAVGRMAAGVAHEIRNPLSSIKGYAHYLRGRLKDDPLACACADLLADETSRINNVLSDMLALSRPPQLNLQKNPLNKIMEKAAMMARPDAVSKKIKLRLDLPSSDSGGWPLTDGDKLLQAVLNLLINAVQFTPAGGEAALSLKKRDGGGWLISVSDSGPGIAESELPQIFNPYYTSREEGTGLGLSITRQIVESHGGEISAFSPPSGGALFTIFLPGADF